MRGIITQSENVLLTPEDNCTSHKLPVNLLALKSRVCLIATPYVSRDTLHGINAISRILRTKTEAMSLIP